MQKTCVEDIGTESMADGMGAEDMSAEDMSAEDMSAEDMSVGAAVKVGIGVDKHWDDTSAEL